MAKVGFIVHMHDRDGDVYEEGIYLCFNGDFVVKVADNPKEFKTFRERLAAMQNEIEEVYEDG